MTPPLDDYHYLPGAQPGQGLWVRRDGFSVPEGMVTPPPAPSGDLVWDRSWYPGPGSQHPAAGTPEFQALGDWRTWDKAYLLPTGSSYPVPAGVTAIYGTSPHWSVLQGKRYRLKAPEPFINPPGSIGLENGTYVLHGLRARHDEWVVNNDKPLTNPDGTPKPMAYGVNRSETAPSLRQAVFLSIKGGGNGAAWNFRAVERSGVLPGADGFLKIMEFVDYDRKTDVNDTLVLNNLRCADELATQGLSHVNWGGTGDHYQGDLLQPIAGAFYRWYGGLVGVSTYQGIFDQSRVTGSFQHAERLWLRGDRGDHGGINGQAYLWWDAMRQDNTITRTWGTGDEGVYVDPLNDDRDTLFQSGSFPNAYSGIVIGQAPRDFVPLSSITNITPGDDPDGDAWDF